MTGSFDVLFGVTLFTLAIYVTYVHSQIKSNGKVDDALIDLCQSIVDRQDRTDRRIAELEK